MRELIGIVKDYGGQAVTAHKVAQLRRNLPGFEEAWAKASQVPGMFAEASGAAFFHMLREVRPTTVVEIGSYLGKSTVFIAETLRRLGLTTSVVHAVDPHTGDRQQMEGLGAAETQMTAQASLFLDHLRVTGTDTIVEPHVTPSVDAASEWSGTIDFLYIDGWHSYDAVIADGAAWLPHLRAGGVVVFDDYSRYADVQRAVNELSRSAFAHWGTVFGQAVGGARGTPPPPSIADLLATTNTRALQRVFRARRG